MEQKKLPVGLIIAGVLIFILLFVNLRTFSKWKDMKKAESSMVKIDGLVVDKDQKDDKFYIEYTFETFDKENIRRNYKKKVEVNIQTYESLAKNGRVYVMVNPNNPKISDITTNTQGKKKFLWIILIDAAALFSFIYMVNTSRTENLIKIG